MIFERTTDVQQIHDLACEPAAWRAAADDFSGRPEDWLPVVGPNVWYILARDQEGLVGLFTLIPRNHILWQIHIAIVPAAWGARAKLAGRGIVDWIWKNTPCKRLIAETPDYNSLAVSLAMASGLKVYGLNPGSIQKNGRLHSLVQLGVSKP